MKQIFSSASRSNPKIFGGKPIVRGRRLAVEHILGMLAAGGTVDDLLRAYPWLEREDVLACTERNLRRAVVNKGGRPRSANPRKLISLRLPVDVIKRWKATGPGWQTRIAERLSRIR